MIRNDGLVHSPNVLFETGFRFNTDLFISLFVGFTFEVIHYRLQDTKKIEKFKMNNKKSFIFKEKLAFRKRKFQNILKSWSFRYTITSTSRYEQSYILWKACIKVLQGNQIRESLTKTDLTSQFGQSISAQVTPSSSHKILFSDLNHTRFENENESTLGEQDENPSMKAEWKPLITINLDQTD